jgi:hypothetical protein
LIHWTTPEASYATTNTPALLEMEAKSAVVKPHSLFSDKLSAEPPLWVLNWHDWK